MAANTSYGKSTKVSDAFPNKAREWYFDPVSQELQTDVEGVQTSLAALGQPKNWG